MHFAELEDIKAGDRIFDIKLQGKVIEKDFDIMKASGGRYTALMKEYKNIATEGTIQIEFVPHDAAGHQPALNGLEIIKE